MLSAVKAPTTRLRAATGTEPRGYCECQDGSHPMPLLAAVEVAMALAGVAGHSYRAPFIVPGARFLQTTPVGAFPICGPCHELGHMAVGGPPSARAVPVTG